MNHNERLIKEYSEWKNENDRINASIISEVREKSLKEGYEKGLEEGIYSNKVEMINNMYNKGISIDIISECANLTTLEVEEIIQKNQKVE